jgi:Glu-tRNA(Gln) amidotransferase subunit E-like FAD-binding protein
MTNIKKTPNKSSENTYNNDMSSGINIATLDKNFLKIQKELEYKKKQLKQDYRMMLKNVKENPFLKTAIISYETYFENEKNKTQAKIAALSKLLHFVKDEVDRFDILREIKQLKKNKF